MLINISTLSSTPHKVKTYIQFQGNFKQRAVQEVLGLPPTPLSSRTLMLMRVWNLALLHALYLP